MPRALIKLVDDPDPEMAARVMQTLMTMGKIDIARLQAAYDG